MRDRGLIVGGLVVFLALITFPFWYAKASGATAQAPKRQLPAAAKQCVAPVEYMRASHMKLLLDWRERVVRGGERKMTLTGTCMKQCHTDKAEFCDRCHSYAGVEGPYCIDCHVDPKRRTE